MINLEIINSTIPDALGKYHFLKNQVSIGSKKSNDILISKEDNFPSTLEFHIEERGLLVKAKSFYSNGKKISGSKLHNVGDLISIGNLELKIIDFKKEQDLDLNAIYQNTINENPKLESLFSALKNELIHIERESNVE